MALLDVGMINAEIHYFMVNVDEKKGMYCYNYREKLCSQLFDTDWSLYEGMTNNDALDAINKDQQPEENSDEATLTGRAIKRKKKQDDIISCTPMMVNQYITTSIQHEDNEEAPVRTYKGVCCQVCMFEGRKTRTKSVAICGKHGIRACLTTPNLSSYKDDKFQTAVEKSTNEELAMWRCPEFSDSCWSKAHSFYIAKGLWGGQGNAPPVTSDHKAFRHHGVKVSSALYKNKEDWMLRHGLISKKGGTRGRKSQKRKTTSTTEQPSTTQTRKRRRRNETTTKITTTQDDELNSEHISSDNDGSDASLDSLLLQQVTQQEWV